MAASAEDPHNDLPSWLWLWFPPLLLIVQLAWRGYDYNAYRQLVESEQGLVELATPVVLLVGVFAGAALWWRRHKIAYPWVRVWLALVTLGCVYFAGEEMSWGQHLVGWETPAFLSNLNDQGETNLHNMSSWFDQKPRLALEIWVLLGGIAYPLLRSCRRTPALDGWRYCFWPTKVVMPTAILALVVRLPERLKPVFDITVWPLEIRYSETQEYYYALFLSIYLLSLARRLGVARE